MGVFPVAALVLAALPVFGQTMARPDNRAIAPDNAMSAERLKSSPRHGEWVDSKSPSGAPLKSFAVYPERTDRASVVLVLHDIGGMGDWGRAVGDQLAQEGFIAIVPDLLSGKRRYLSEIPPLRMSSVVRG
jgi:carboxymethylenebutenolidase